MRHRCLGIGFLAAALLGTAHEARADAAFLQSILICLATADTPSARGATFERYGFTLGEDEYEDPNRDQARKDKVFAEYAHRTETCFISKQGLTYAQAARIVAGNIEKHHPIARNGMGHCPGGFEFVIDGKRLTLFLLNASTYEVTCDPDEPVEVRLRRYVSDKECARMGRRCFE